MKKIIKIIRSNEGSILVFVLMVFLVIFIVSMSVLYLNETNTKQVAAQRDSLHAYYIAYSGIEIGYAALMADNEQLLKKIINDSPHTLSTKDPKYGDIKYGKDNKDTISIDIEYTPDDKNITIISKGTHNDSNRSTTLTMSYPVDFPSLRTWK